jgi:hypothetical protein
MVRTISTGAAFLLCLGTVWSSAVLAQTSLTRTSSFVYDPASGLLTQEVVEPNTTALRLETDYVYDAFGNKTSVQGRGMTSRIGILADRPHLRSCCRNIDIKIPCQQAL